MAYPVRKVSSSGGGYFVHTGSAPQSWSYVVRGQRSEMWPVIPQCEQVGGGASPLPCLAVPLGILESSSV